MKTIITEEKIFVVTPFDSDLPRRFRNLKGRWESPAWEFKNDPDILKGIQGILLDVFGWDGTGPTRTVKIRTTETHRRRGLPVTLAGFALAEARGRDSGARTGQEVTLLSGRIGSGGSVKNWESVVYADTEFKIEGFPSNFILPEGFEYIEEESEEDRLEREIKEKAEELKKLKDKLKKLKEKNK